MKGTKREIPKGTKTAMIVMDPQVGFIGEQGTIAKKMKFGKKEIEPHKEALRQIKCMLRYCSRRIWPILVQSLYQPGQFDHEHPKLHDLCTRENEKDLAIMLPDEYISRFRETVTKHTNRLMLEEDTVNGKQRRTLRKRILGGDFDHIIWTGFTSTTCVENAISDTRQLAMQKDLNIRHIVTRDTCSARLSRQDDHNALMDRLSSPKVKDVEVYNTLRDMTFEK